MIAHIILADCTYGHAIGTVLRPSVVCTECIVAKWCVLEQKLLLRTYRKSHMRNRLVPKMNDLDLYLEVVQGHVNHCGVNNSKTT